MVGLRLGPKFVVFMFDPGDIETVLKNTKQVEKANEYRFLRPWLGDGVLLSSGLYLVKRLYFSSHCNLHRKQIQKAQETDNEKHAFKYP